MSNPALEAEVQRLQCLQALGIAVYHPRFRLPGAKPSVQGPWPEVDSSGDGAASRRGDTPRAAHQVDMSVDAPRPAIDDRHFEKPREAVREASETQVAPQRPGLRMALDADLSTPAAKPAASASASAAAAMAPRKPANTAAAVQTFQLLFLQVDSELVVINQIPALARPQLHDKPLALLANLLRWLGKSMPAQAPRVFRWPLPGLENMAATMNAETSLLHFLEQACTERPFRYVLHLGPQAVAAPSSTWQSFATHSLDEMLAQPVLKREAWQALLPLHAHLHDPSHDSPHANQ
jgi:hypothetical protein